MKAYGADTLVQVMGSVLDEELIDTLHNVQIASIKEKEKYAHGAVITSSIATLAEGFSPIPFADAALLIPTQVAMIASITVVFGLSVNKALITSFISSALGTTGVTIAGKTLATNLLKFIPGYGTIAGGMISGTTAALLTTALGEAYIKLLVSVSKGELKDMNLEDESTKAKMKDFFQEELKNKKDF